MGWFLKLSREYDVQGHFQFHTCVKCDLRHVSCLRSISSVLLPDSYSVRGHGCYELHMPYRLDIWGSQSRESSELGRGITQQALATNTVVLSLPNLLSHPAWPASTAFPFPTSYSSSRWGSCSSCLVSDPGWLCSHSQLSFPSGFVYLLSSFCSFTFCHSFLISSLAKVFFPPLIQLEAWDFPLRHCSANYKFIWRPTCLELVFYSHHSRVVSMESFIKGKPLPEKWLELVTLEGSLETLEDDRCST